MSAEQKELTQEDVDKLRKQFQDEVKQDIKVVTEFMKDPENQELTEEGYESMLRLASAGVTLMEAILVLSETPTAIIKPEDAPWCLVDFQMMQMQFAQASKRQDDSRIILPKNQIFH